MKTLNQYLLEQSCNFRCGISLPVQKVKTNFCDISGVYNYSVPEDVIDIWKTASGSINFDENKAIMGAIGESIERYSSAICNFDLKSIDELKDKEVLTYEDFSLFSDEQYKNPNFKWKRPNKEQQFFGKVYSLYDNSEVYIPEELIGLGSRIPTGGTIPSTSTGVAAHTDKYDALYSAILEVLERDALTVTWLNSLGGRKINLEDKYIKEVKEKNGKVFCFDVTQDWNPFPVVIVCGFLLSNGKKRISMGVACRENYKLAIEKAYLEWIQGCIFAGYYDEYHANLDLDYLSEIKDFDLHAVYYTIHPEKWDLTPLLKNRKPYQYKEKNDNLTLLKTEEKLEFLLKNLKKEEIRFYYKDLSTIDTRDIPLYVMRVVSPDLSLIHGDENCPFLGGRTSDVKWRYKNLESGEFPNIFPHPLG